MTLLVHLLGVLLLFTTYINCQEDSVEKLIALSSELTNHENKFVASFQGVNPAQILCPENSYQSYMTFSLNYRTKINETFGRFTQLHCIVFANVTVQQKYNENAFYDFALRPNNLFIFIVNCRFVENSCKNSFVSWYIYNCLKNTGVSTKLHKKPRHSWAKFWQLVIFSIMKFHFPT